MTRRVFLHLGLPKTGTSYLQTIVWAHRPELRRAGLLVPGRERRDHLWASLEVRGDRRLARRGEAATQAWSVLQAELTAAFAGAGEAPDALIDHEFFCSASAEQATATVEALQATGAEEVHLVLTAREPLGLFTSSWQESLKNKGTSRIGDYARTVSTDPTDVWDWRALDLGLVLGRWAPAVPPERVHVITPPGRDQPREELWRRFAGVLGVDPGVVTPETGFANSSMGLAEAETLRRVNERLVGFDRALDRGVWIRSFLADDRLVPRRGEPFWPGEDQIADCRARGEAAIALIAREGYDVVGDPASLAVPEDLPARRHPDSVTEAEVAEVAVDLVADLLGAVREEHTSQREGHRPRPTPLRGRPGQVARIGARIRARVRGLRTRGS